MEPLPLLTNPLLDRWETDPMGAFALWIGDQPGNPKARKGSGRVKRSTTTVYYSLWSRFVAWRVAKLHGPNWDAEIRRAHKGAWQKKHWAAALMNKQFALALRSVDAHEISAFLCSLTDENLHQRERYRSLLERVFAELLRLWKDTATRNPAGSIQMEIGYIAWRQGVSGNLPMSFLTEEERARVVEVSVSPSMEPVFSKRWRSMRDKTMLALYLGAGLKVGECTALTIKCISESSGCVRIEDRNSKFVRTVTPADYAIRALQDWLAIRRDPVFHGHRPEDILFPSAKEGKAMHYVTALRVATDLLEEAGVRGNRLLSTSEATKGLGRRRKSDHLVSPQTLRNSYAAAMIEAGKTDGEIQDGMGFAEEVSARRLREAYALWREARVNSPACV